MGSTPDIHAAYSLKERQKALEAVLRSAAFSRNPRLGKLLEYICSKSFAGESGYLKEYTIATDVFGRAPEFDQSTDAIVRVEMHRLRKKLKDFYAGEGLDQNVEIIIQSGHYTPEFIEHRSGVADWKDESFPASATPPKPVAVPHRQRWVPFAAMACAVGLAAIAWFFFSIKAKSEKSVDHSVSSAASAPATPALPQTDAIRILSGRLHSKARDREGNNWGQDAFFEGGTALEAPDAPIYRTRDAFLFSGMRSGDFSYKIPLKPANYELHLYFADTSFDPGMAMEGGENTRFFNVELNGRALLRDFDIIAGVGPHTADERVFKDVQPDKDGYLHLHFSRVVSTPLLNAIEILPATPHQMRPVRVSTQDSEFTDKSGVTWEPDNYFLQGRGIAKLGIVAGPVDSQIFERERYGNFSYAIPAAPGKYKLTLYFAETYFGPGEQGGGGIGDRIFDVYCNGVALLEQLDVFKEAGARRQLIKTFHGIQANAQGNVLISFVPRRNYAMISAIELIDESNQ